MLTSKSSDESPIYPTCMCLVGESQSKLYAVSANHHATRWWYKVHVKLGLVYICTTKDVLPTVGLSVQLSQPVSDGSWCFPTQRLTLWQPHPPSYAIYSSNSYFYACKYINQIETIVLQFGISNSNNRRWVAYFMIARVFVLCFDVPHIAVK